MPTPFELHGQEYSNCNCAYGCPCQFNALPTYGDCQYFMITQIDEGHFGETSLNGVVFAIFGKFPGAVHEGDGTQQLVLDERSNAAQRKAIRAIVYNEEDYEVCFHFAVYHAMSTTSLEPVVGSISFEADIAARTAKANVPGLFESTGEPIRNPATGEEHRARIVLPEGFGFTTAEMGSGTSTTQEPIPLHFKDSYAQFNELHLTQNGVIR